MTPATCGHSHEIQGLVQTAATLYAGFAVPGTVFRDIECASRGVTHRPHALTIHIRSGEIFTNWCARATPLPRALAASHAVGWHLAYSHCDCCAVLVRRDGKHVTSHGGFQHEAFSRGQPPLSFYTTAAAHALDLGSGGKKGLYDHVAIATSPDRSNPVVGAMLARPDCAGCAEANGAEANGSWPAGARSAALGLPLTLASSASFADDLAQLLCARHLVLADSSLNVMLHESPNLRDVYEFTPWSCPPPVACQPRSSGGGTAASGVRHWCVAPQPSAGNYSVSSMWLNTEAQRREMVTYGSGGAMGPPVLVKGPPLPC